MFECSGAMVFEGLLDPKHYNTPTLEHYNTPRTVSSNAVRIVARVLWILPALWFFLTVDQVKVALDLKATWEAGTPATAEVVTFENSNRADVTYGYVSLRVPLADGQVLMKEKMSLPQSLLPRLQGQETLAVRVRLGAAQEVVIAQLMPAHWLIAASQAGISLLGAILFFTGVFWWNRYLKKKGDPARRTLDEEEAVVES